MEHIIDILTITFHFIYLPSYILLYKICFWTFNLSPEMDAYCFTKMPFTQTDLDGFNLMFNNYKGSWFIRWFHPKTSWAFSWYSSSTVIIFAKYYTWYFLPGGEAGFLLKLYDMGYSPQNLHLIINVLTKSTVKVDDILVILKEVTDNVNFNDMFIFIPLLELITEAKPQDISILIKDFKNLKDLYEPKVFNILIDWLKTMHIEVKSQDIYEIFKEFNDLNKIADNQVIHILNTLSQAIPEAKSNDISIIFKEFKNLITNNPENSQVNHLLLHHLSTNIQVEISITIKDFTDFITGNRQVISALDGLLNGIIQNKSKDILLEEFKNLITDDFYLSFALNNLLESQSLFKDLIKTKLEVHGLFADIFNIINFEVNKRETLVDSLIVNLLNNYPDVSSVPAVKNQIKMVINHLIKDNLQIYIPNFIRKITDILSLQLPFADKVDKITAVCEKASLLTLENLSSIEPSKALINLSTPEILNHLNNLFILTENYKPMYLDISSHFPYDLPSFIKTTTDLLYHSNFSSVYLVNANHLVLLKHTSLYYYVDITKSLINMDITKSLLNTDTYTYKFIKTFESLIPYTDDAFKFNYLTTLKYLFWWQSYDNINLYIENAYFLVDKPQCMRSYIEIINQARVSDMEITTDILVNFNDIIKYNPTFEDISSILAKLQRLQYEIYHVKSELSKAKLELSQFKLELSQVKPKVIGLIKNVPNN